MGVEQRQVEFLTSKRNSLLEKRRRRAEREGKILDEEGLKVGEQKSVVESLKESIGAGRKEDGRSGVEGSENETMKGSPTSNAAA